MTFFPDDTYYSFQWHLDNPISGGIGMKAAYDKYGWGLIDIGAALLLAADFDEDKVINLSDLRVWRW